LHRKIFAETDFDPQEWSASDLGIEDEVGLAVSPTQVGGMDTADPVPRENERVDDAEELAEHIAEVL
jgi:electron transfer flavoprotein beta subunit